MSPYFDSVDAAGRLATGGLDPGIRWDPRLGQYVNYDPSIEPGFLPGATAPGGGANPPTNENMLPADTGYPSSQGQPGQEFYDSIWGQLTSIGEQQPSITVSGTDTNTQPSATIYGGDIPPSGISNVDSGVYPSAQPVGDYVNNAASGIPHAIPVPDWVNNASRDIYTPSTDNYPTTSDPSYFTGPSPPTIYQGGGSPPDFGATSGTSWTILPGGQIGGPEGRNTFGDFFRQRNRPLSVDAANAILADTSAWAPPNMSRWQAIQQVMNAGGGGWTPTLGTPNSRTSSPRSNQ